jgi:hypothetical protein
MGLSFRGLTQHGAEDKAATEKDSAIDKLFCSNFERTAEMRYSSASNKSRYLFRCSRLLNRAAEFVHCDAA